MDNDEMRRRVAAARVARLGTVDAHGRAHLVPFVHVLDGDTLFSSVDDKPKTTRKLARTRNIERDPRVTVLVDHYDETWERLWWVRLRGSARILVGGDEAARGWRLLTDKYEQYAGQPADEVIIAIDVDEWLGWSYSD